MGLSVLWDLHTIHLVIWSIVNIKILIKCSFKKFNGYIGCHYGPINEKNRDISYSMLLVPKRNYFPGPFMCWVKFIPLQLFETCPKSTIDFKIACVQQYWKHTLFSLLPSSLPHIFHIVAPLHWNTEIELVISSRFPVGHTVPVAGQHVISSKPA